MIRNFYRILAVLLAGTTCVASANGPQNAQVKPLDRSQRQVCKSEIPIGSMIPGPKRCHTAAEWEDLARAGEANARLLTERPAGPTGH